MKAVFVELPAFERRRADYLDDKRFRGLQDALMENPGAGEMADLTPQQKKTLKAMLKAELDSRRAI